MNSQLSTRKFRFDETLVAHATLADLEDGLWRRFAPADSSDTAETLLSKLAMAAQDEQGVWRPIVAGLLMGCRAPQRFLSSAYVQAVAYQGHSVVPEGDSIYQRDAQDITGPLDRQIQEACHFVRKNMWVAARKLPQGGRQDLPQFDMLAVFEAVTNAVAHRDYSMAGSKVRLRLFDDRLELYSPGMLSNTMTTRCPCTVGTSWTSGAKACLSSWQRANGFRAGAPSTACMTTANCC